MKLAYLTNQYPKISHSFIRREILALEAQGMPISRFAIRRAAEPLHNESDQRELARTEILLARGPGALLASVWRTASTHPRGLGRALKLTLQMGWRSHRGLARHFAYLAEACLLRERCAAESITHVHVHHATNPAAVALLCHALGGPPYSLTIHGPEEFEHASQLALNLKIAHATFVVTVSEWSRRQLFQWCDSKQQAKIHVVRCGVGESFTATVPTRLPDTPHFLWVGRLSEQKDPLAMVRAIARLRAANLFCTVTMLGDGDLRPVVEQEIRRSNLGDRITLAGWASSEMVLHHLQKARALVLSSRAENVPSVIMEALAQGRPVVSTKVGGIAELVQDGKTGWLVPPSSPEQLAAALRSVLEIDIQPLSRMGQAGREFVLENFSSTVEAQKLRALMNEASPGQGAQ